MNAQTEHLAEVERCFNRIRLQVYAQRHGEDMLRRMEQNRMTPSDRAWVREALKAILGES